MRRPKLDTFGIKLSELRPCDACGKKLVPFFQHVQLRHAVFNAQNTNGVLGLTQMFGGSAKALAIAEVMAPGGDDAVEVLNEPDTLFICNECFLQPLNLAELAERRATKETGHAG